MELDTVRAATPSAATPSAADRGGSSTPTGAAAAFGMSLLAVDDRLRLFSFAVGADRFTYLWVLRAFDRARQRYRVRLHTAEVAAELAELAAEHAGVPEPANLASSLDQLVDWNVLERMQDGARVASIAEYRRRNSVYQFSVLGLRAYQAVEAVVSATLTDTALKKLAFTAILDDLQGLAAANTDGDAVGVYLRLDRLHQALSDMTERAAQFYLMIGELARTHEARPEVFVAYKDRLLAHLTDFLAELQRYKPLLAAAVATVAAGGVDALVERAAEADDDPFLRPVERLARWRQRWDGLAAWFLGDGVEPSAADRLDGRTAAAISDLTALLRRVTETRRSGVSRDSQLRFLARWLAACATDAEAQALFSAATGLRRARHLSLTEEDQELVPATRSWWEAPPMPVSTTLRERGMATPPGRPAVLRDNAAARAAALAVQRERRAAEQTAAARMAADGLAGRVLDRAELDLLLRLLDRALQARVPVAGSPTRPAGALAEAHHGRLRLRLAPGGRDTVVRTVDGELLLPGLDLEVSSA